MAEALAVTVSEDGTGRVYAPVPAGGEWVLLAVLNGHQGEPRHSLVTNQ